VDFSDVTTGFDGEVSELTEFRPRRKSSGFFSGSKRYEQEVYQLQKEIELIKHNISTLPIVRAKSRSNVEILPDHSDARLRLMDVMEESPVVSQARAKSSNVSFVTDRKSRHGVTGNDVLTLADDISLPKRLSSGLQEQEGRQRGQIGLVGHTDIGQTDTGHTDVGQTDIGHTDRSYRHRSDRPLIYKQAVIDGHLLWMLEYSQL
jgi:hypothetical protein